MSQPLALGRADTPVRMTVELAWRPPAQGTRALPAVELIVADGQVVEAIVWPDDHAWRVVLESGSARVPLGQGQTGKVRARVEAPIGTTLQLHFGDHAVKFPLAALLDGPQRLTQAGMVEVEASRVPWDGLEVRLGDQAFDGTVPPGASVPLLIGTNVLTPEPAEVTVSLSAELRPVRGGEPVWRLDRQEFTMATNGPVPSRAVLLPVPKVEGTYALEVKATWTPSETAEGSRLARWWRRRRQAQAEPTSASRRVTLAVLAPKGPLIDATPTPSPAAEQRADLCDLARGRALARPIASGRAPRGGPGWSWPVPEAAWVQSGRLDRLKGLLPRVGGGPDPAQLGGVDGTGVSWTALGLKVPHPGRPHRLAVTVAGGQPSALGVGLLAWGTGAGGEGRARVLLDACVSSDPIGEGGNATSFSWPVWPDSADPVLVLFNRGAGPVRVGTIELTELAAPQAPAVVAEKSTTGRELGLDLTGPHDLDRFGGADDPTSLARDLAAHAAACGVTFVVLPAPAGARARRGALDGQWTEDGLGPDRTDVLLRQLERAGLSVWFDVRFDGPLPGLPSPDKSEAIRDGLALIDRFGRAEPASYNPLHPEVRAAMARRVAEALAPRSSRPALTGLVVRLGPAPTLPGPGDCGLDDESFARFVREKLDQVSARNVPGLTGDDPARFAARHQFLSGPGRIPWLSWRAGQVGLLYANLAKVAARTAPGATLAVVTPGLDEGPVGQEARRADLAGLAPDQAWRNVGLDLSEWPVSPDGPVVLRGVNASADDLGRDLATSPELDSRVGARPDRGLFAWATCEPTTGGDVVRLSAPPVNFDLGGDDLLGHALAALDARRVVLSGAVATGREARLREFAQVFRSLPYASGPAPARLPSGVAVRAWSRPDSTFIALANDTPYPIALETTLAVGESVMIEELGRASRPEVTGPAGARRLALEMPAYGVTALKVGATGARVTSAVPRHSETVKAMLEAQSRDLSERLTRLARAGDTGGLGPANPGFEPEASASGRGEVRVVRNAPGLVGWKSAGIGSHAADIDTEGAHSGQGSLRLTAQSPPASVVSEAFVPPFGPSITARFWLRADPPGSAVRFRLDGESGGQSLARQAELVPGAAWSEFAVRLSDLPISGLDRARLRFELLAPGKLWVDDLSLVGGGPSEVERLKARQRTILAAVQAYREHRYADFARLSASHWVRPVPSDPDAPASPAVRTVHGAGGPEAGGTDLPAGRRLR
jgi:hypothetical protein